MPISLDTGFAPITFSINGDSWRRNWVATGLNSGPDYADLAKEIEALLPAKGDAAPAPLDYLIADNIQIEHIWRERNPDGTYRATHAGRGQIAYRPPSFVVGPIQVPDENGPGITVNRTTTIEPYETSYAADGSQITTEYDGVTQAHTYTASRTLVTHNFLRPEDRNPRARRDVHMGTVNAAEWNGYAAETVLLSELNDRTSDNVSWMVDYTFVWRSDGWEVEIVHEDPLFPGHPLPLAGLSAPELAAAAILIKRYSTSDFSALNITL